MQNLRETILSDLADTLEGEFGLPVPITYGIDGDYQDKSANDATKDLKGQIIYETPEVNLDTGDTKLVPITAVTYRRTSLNKIPSPGDRVILHIPGSPTTIATKVEALAGEDNQQRHGRSLGIITFYVQNIVQSV